MLLVPEDDERGHHSAGQRAEDDAACPCPARDLTRPVAKDKAASGQLCYLRHRLHHGARLFPCDLPPPLPSRWPVSTQVCRRTPSPPRRSSLFPSFPQLLSRLSLRIRASGIDCSFLVFVLIPDERAVLNSDDLRPCFNHEEEYPFPGNRSLGKDSSSCSVFCDFRWTVFSIPLHCFSGSRLNARDLPYETDDSMRCGLSSKNQFQQGNTRQ